MSTGKPDIHVRLPRFLFVYLHDQISVKSHPKGLSVSFGLCAKVTVSGTALAATYHHITYEQNRGQSQGIVAQLLFKCSLSYSHLDQTPSSSTSHNQRESAVLS